MAVSDKYKGAFTWAPLTQVGWWQIKANSVSLKGKNFKQNFAAIVDSGTTVIYGDEATVRAIFKAVPGAKDASKTIAPGAFTVPCANMPSLSFNLGGMPITVSAATLNLGTVDQAGKTCLAGLAFNSLDFWVLGDVFMRNVYTRESCLVAFMLPNSCFVYRVRHRQQAHRFRQARLNSAFHRSSPPPSSSRCIRTFISHTSHPTHTALSRSYLCLCADTLSRTHSLMDTVAQSSYKHPSPSASR